MKEIEYNQRNNVYRLKQQQQEKMYSMWNEEAKKKKQQKKNRTYKLSCQIFLMIFSVDEKLSE